MTPSVAVWLSQPRECVEKSSSNRSDPGPGGVSVARGSVSCAGSWQAREIKSRTAKREGAGERLFMGEILSSSWKLLLHYSCSLLAHEPIWIKLQRQVELFIGEVSIIALQVGKRQVKMRGGETRMILDCRHERASRCLQLPCADLRPAQHVQCQRVPRRELDRLLCSGQAHIFHLDGVL